jgi:hypothetical protein
MPKERLHLLIADQSLQFLTPLLSSLPLSEDHKLAYFLGAISPDALFYDVPSCRLSSLGTAFHRLQGESCLPILEPVLREQRDELSPEATAWILGVASHFLTDGIWHPIIEKMCGPATVFCRAFKLSGAQCHHWLESELEGYWLPRIGPEDDYLPFLKHFARKNKTREDCIRCFRMVLMRLGLKEVPDEKKIGRCLFWQALLLYQFSLASWARWRKLLLDVGPTRSLGALIVPTFANSSLLAKSGSQHQVVPFDDPCDDEFMARSVIALASHQHVLFQKL